MLPIARPRYLHPNQCYQQERSWNYNYSANNYSANNYSKNNNNYNYVPTHHYYGPPTSPCLKEVLSSYTPGPTIIMMEKKKRSSCLKTNWKLLCIVILCILGFFVIATSLYSKIGTISNDLPVEPSVNQHVPLNVHPHIGNLDNNNNNKENLSGYGYPNRQIKYLNIIHSMDEDEESFVEVVEVIPS